jgi:hypothetical protein
MRGAREIDERRRIYRYVGGEAIEAQRSRWAFFKSLERVLGKQDSACQQLLTLCLLLRVAPVPWPQDLHAVTAVDPLWVHVCCGLRRFSRGGGR